MPAIENTILIKNEAARLGFMSCGIAKAEFLEDDAKRLESWLSKGRHGKMQYMENHFEMRVNPQQLVPGAKSVITLLYNYFPKEEQQPDVPKIAKYAYGTDYHYVIREKLNVFLDFIKTHIGEVEGRGFVDSAPVLERAWALRSGLGWIGKNTHIISKQTGSYFFIATLITDLELIYDAPFKTDHCGTCTRCIDACPTDAILPGRELDAHKCISYLTIELKDAMIAESFQGKMEGWIFGCDICQDVCPWNRFAQPHNELHFTPIPEVLHLSKKEWETLTEESFKKIFKKSPLYRTKWKGLQRNIKMI